MLNNNRYINLLLASFFVVMMGFVLFANAMYENFENQQLGVESSYQATELND